MLCFCSQFWSFWDGPVLLTSAAKTAVYTATVELSSYTHSALHVLFFQLFFRGQLFLLGLQQCSEHAEISPLSFAASLVSVFYNFLFLLLPTSKCQWEQPLVPLSIAYPYKDLPLNFVSVQEEKERRLTLAMCYKHLLCACCSSPLRPACAFLGCLVT